MIRNYLKTAWRNLLNHKSFSFINIFGLAIGIAACMIIFLYVHNELGFDKYNLNYDRIARVTTTVHAPESDLPFAPCAAPLADALKRDCPEVEATVRLEPSPKVMKLNNELVREEGFYTADQSIFSVFSFDFLEGSAAGALQNPNSIVITQTIAKKYFGTMRAKGKILICEGQDFLVTGVVKDRPANSDIHIDALLSYDFSKITSWMDDLSVFTFVLFKQKTDLKNFEQKLVAMSAKYVQPELNAMGGKDYRIHFELEPLSAVHFIQGKLQDTPKGNKQSSYLFSWLALSILIIALLNYINLSTAKSTERAKEVGIRKVCGALQFQLTGQFLFESFVLVTLAWILALSLVRIALPFFNQLLQTKLAIDWGQGILFVGVIFLVTFLLAGFYPALVLSAFRPVQVLKGSWRNSGKGVLLRKTITVTQFAIATALILGTTVIYKQIRFIDQKDLGFDKDQLLNIYLPRDSAYLNSVRTFQNDLRHRSEIRGLTVGNGMTEDGLSIATTIAESAVKKRELLCNYYAIDPFFLPVFQIHLLEGRNLSDRFSTDKEEAFIVNEAFVKTMGWKSALGKSIEGFGHKGKVIGVARNFYYKSLHNLVEPLVLIYNTFPANTTTVKIRPQDLPIVKELYKKNFPTQYFDYSFFDEMVNKQYEKDRTTMSLFGEFTLLAIFVSCLGLYGLVALITVQRTKEVGIRKVLGASVSQILSLMTKDIVKLVFWALVISLPLAAIAMKKWLNSYAYHIQLNGWIFIIPVFFILFIALAVVSREIIKISWANPVQSLRNE
jgi:putative ABC transport system permease protein